MVAKNPQVQISAADLELPEVSISNGNGSGSGATAVPVGADLITEIEGQPVTGADSMTRVMNHKRGGDILNLTVYRDGRPTKVQVKLEEAPQVM